MMGSPEDEPERKDREKLHWVSLTKGYWLAETACSQGFWQEVMGVNPSEFQSEVSNTLPIERVSWHDCQVMMNRLNDRVALIDARLPTEAEWEYACRAGTTTPFSFGEQLSSELANYDEKYSYNGQEKGEGRRMTMVVDAFVPNAWGLYQMHGNVFEWCADWYGEYFEGEAVDPVGPETGSYRIRRGGGWDYSGRYLRSAYRFSNAPDLANFSTGLRLALS